MRLPRYPEYQDSGTAWLGQVPAHWASNKLKYVATFSGGGTPNRDVPAYWNGDIPWVSPKDMKAESIHGAEEYITESGLKNSTANLIEPEHVLMVVRSGILKHTIPVAINRVPVALNQDMKAISMDRRKCEPAFFARWVQGLNDDLLLAWAKQGATVESIEQVYLADTPLPLPPISEQRDICRFLDHETAKIDGLIGEQEKLITLLAEKRQATISHAVTRGLNPQAPMKDSGVPWLGEVPAHWVRTPIKHALNSIIDTEHKTVPFYEDGEFLVARTSNIKDGTLTLDEARYTDALGYAEWTKRGKPVAGDIILTREAPAGEACIVPSAPPLCLGQRTVLLKPNLAMINPRYALWSIYGGLAAEFVAVLAQGSTVAHFNMSDIGNIPVLLPPLEEQAAVVEFIDAEVGKLDQLRIDSCSAIGLLKERRSALIAAAVTGQIDVRGFTAA